MRGVKPLSRVSPVPGRVIGVIAATAAIALSVAGVGQAETASVPKKSMPVTILYSGSFDMKNKADPESTAHSYTFTVTWTYWWTGTWGALFRDPSILRSSPEPFTKVKIAGGVDSTYLEKVGDKAVQSCSSPIFRDSANRPAVSAAYDASANTLQVVVEAPTFRGIKYGNLNCADGPGTNVFGPGQSQTPPRSFNPLGGGGTVRLSTGGTASLAKSSKWTHGYASATSPPPTRTVEATMRSKVMVAYTPCKLIPACARAKP